MGWNPAGDFGNGQSVDIKIAKELKYPYEVIQKLANEPSALKRQHILTDARKKMVERELHDGNARVIYRSYNERK